MTLTPLPRAGSSLMLVTGTSGLTLITIALIIATEDPIRSSISDSERLNDEKHHPTARGNRGDRRWRGPPPRTDRLYLRGSERRLDRRGEGGISILREARARAGRCAPVLPAVEGMGRE